MKDVTLALGGGGVKGNAHVGVMQVLEREGFTIRAIAGTSAGGMWGALYAAGLHPEEIEKFILQVEAGSLYRRRPDVDGPSMMGLGGVEHMLRMALGDKTFEDLSLPFAVTAVDLNTAEPLILNSGSLVEAILATIAVPGIFPPANWHGRMLIDGGVLDPVPVRLARLLAPGVPVVAVVLSPPVAEWVKPQPPRLFDSLPFLSGYIARLRIARAINIFLRSIDIAGANLTDLRLEVDRPEVIIRPAVPHIGLLDEVDVAEVIQLGAEATEQALPLLNKAVSWRSRVARRFNSQRDSLRLGPAARVAQHIPE